MSDPQEMRVLTERELEVLPDGAVVVDDEGYRWERGGDWWRLEQAHMVLRSWELWAISRHVCQLVPFSPAAVLE